MLEVLIVAAGAASDGAALTRLGRSGCLEEVCTGGFGACCQRIAFPLGSSCHYQGKPAIETQYSGLAMCPIECTVILEFPVMPHGRKPITALEAVYTLAKTYCRPDMDALTGQLSVDEYWRTMMGKLVAKMAGDVQARVFVQNCAILPGIIMEIASYIWTPLDDLAKAAVIIWTIVAGLVAWVIGYGSKITSIMSTVMIWLLMFPFVATILGDILSDADLGRFVTMGLVVLGLVWKILKEPPARPFLQRTLRRLNADHNPPLIDLSILNPFARITDGY